MLLLHLIIYWKVFIFHMLLYDSITSLYFLLTYTIVCLRIYPKKNVEGYLFFFINVIIVKIYLFSFKYIDIIIYVICSVFLSTIRCLSYVSIY